VELLCGVAVVLLLPAHISMNRADEIDAKLQALKKRQM